MSTPLRGLPLAFLLPWLVSACGNGGNQAPVADAGEDQVVFVGETVQLDGSGSSDPEGDALAALWEFETMPAASQTGHGAPTEFRSSFTPDVPGLYRARLAVDDGNSVKEASQTDTVEIQALVPLPFQGIAIDYDPEARCSDDNWTTNTPVACSPQLSFTCPAPPPGDPFQNLSGCPDRCQSCFDQDLAALKSNLLVGTITVYQPNYYILKAAQAQGLKVLLGLFNDSVLALTKTNDGNTDCTFAGFPALCGDGVVASLVDGACGATTPWAPQTFCTAGTYIPALKPFFDDGTVVGIQLGNEILSSPINGVTLTPAQVQAAATTLRNGLNQRSYTGIPVIVSSVAGLEKDLCADGAPLPNIDGIASHPYCNNVASVPPAWPFESGNTPAQAAKACADQVLSIFQEVAVTPCGADHVFIGETGYNTGCPGASDEANHLAAAESFFPEMVSLACQNNIPLFFFDYVDACPAGGCLPGCSGEANVGNGYFGIYHTENYLTKGDLVLKYSAVPNLGCP
ncbi:MAG: hypothetical protein IT573_03685 [Deltaproteobacteria bacterium]|nr:hypothetical protein [Deltaproteobacteria bacterium]